ncbi:hypothetical protein SDC9_159778 [bioreactor metagenome]|uniref:Uncharacterized protein n=1 Tax=bioreactor metagenome TaxID=1076179 RepID=A0A645FER5_9ZZZZ
MPGHRLHALQADLGMAEALGKGKEIVVEHLLPGGGQGGNGAPVEGVFQGDYRAPPLAVLVEAVLSGQLNHALVALRAGIGEEGGGHAAAQAELLGQQSVGLGIKEVGDMPQLQGLLQDGVGPFGVSVAHGGYADAGGKVDVLLAGQVIQGGALPVVDVHGEAAVGLHHILLVQSLKRFQIHIRHFLTAAWCRCPRWRAFQ